MRPLTLAARRCCARSLAGALCGRGFRPARQRRITPKRRRAARAMPNAGERCRRSRSFAATVERPLFSPSRRPAANAAGCTGGIAGRYRLQGLAGRRASRGARSSSRSPAGASLELGEGDKLEGWTVKRSSRTGSCFPRPRARPTLRRAAARPENPSAAARCREWARAAAAALPARGAAGRLDEIFRLDAVGDGEGPAVGTDDRIIFISSAVKGREPMRPNTAIWWPVSSTPRSRSRPLRQRQRRRARRASRRSARASARARSRRNSGWLSGDDELDHLEPVRAVGDIGEQRGVGRADDHVARVVERAVGGELHDRACGCSGCSTSTIARPSRAVGDIGVGARDKTRCASASGTCAPATSAGCADR